MSKKQKLTPDEIFEELESIPELKIKIYQSLFSPDSDNSETIDKKNAKILKEFEFSRSVLNDLRPDENFIDDDLLTNPAIYFYYGVKLSFAKRYLAACMQEYDRVRGRVYQKKAREIYRNPDLEAKLKSVTFINAEVDNVQSVILLRKICDDAQMAVDLIEIGLKAMEHKHYSCQSISKKKSAEAGLIGSSHVAKDISNKRTSHYKVEDSETDG